MLQLKLLLLSFSSQHKSPHSVMFIRMLTVFCKGGSFELLPGMQQAEVNGRARLAVLMDCC